MNLVKPYSVDADFQGIPSADAGGDDSFVESVSGEDSRVV
jgi:hypothetical protein